MAWRPHSLGIIAVVVPLVFLAACNSNKQETIPTTTTKTPAPPPITTTTSPGPPTTAPPVAEPLDASAYEADPCTSLTDTQKHNFDIDRAEPVDISPAGNECQFGRRPDEARAIWVIFASDVETGLSAKYLEHAAGTWVYWEPTEVDRYPAVAFGSAGEPLHCFFAVGVSDQLYYYVSAESPSGQQRCTTARSVATAILENIKAAG